MIYDRAGIGLNELGPVPRSTQQIVTELHTMLVNGGYEPPFILVGHSIGAIHIRDFANRYPGEVAGMVFVDGSHEHFFAKFYELYPAEWAQYLQYVDSLLNPNTTFALEWKAVKETFPGLGNIGPIPDVPIVVLTGVVDWTVFFSPEFISALGQLWYEAHDQLARSVTNDLHIFADKSGHFIHHDQPQLVIDAIQHVVEVFNQQKP